MVPSNVAFDTQTISCYIMNYISQELKVNIILTKNTLGEILQLNRKQPLGCTKTIDSALIVWR